MITSNKVKISRHVDRDEFNRASLSTILDKMRTALAERDVCSIALSGGRTPRGVFELLAKEDINWNAVNIFWVDERCVRHDDPNNNFKAVHGVLLSRISIPQENVHRVEVEGLSPEEAAEKYESRLKEFFCDGLPSFDLVLLGMGADGHTASLFPGDTALREKKHWVAAVDGAKGDPPVPRVTLTLPVINNSKCVLFLVTGGDKMHVFEEIVDNKGDYPAGHVRSKGELIWHVFDKDLEPRS